MQRKLLLASSLYYWSCPWLISGERRHFKTRAAHLQFQRAGTVTLMWVDFKVWCPKAQRSLLTTTRPHLSHYSLDLEGDGTWVTGYQTHRLKGFKAHKDMSPWPKSTNRMVRTTPWPESRALFLHDEGSWQSTFSWEPRPSTWTSEKSVKPLAEV